MTGDRDVLVSGETLVDFLPDQPGQLRDVAGFSRRAGGAPANVAVGLARLDRTPWFWTRLARDPFGAFLAGTLEREGLPDRFVERDPEARTALAFVAHDEAADRGFTFYRDDTADTRLEPGGVPDAALADVDWVYVGGVMLATEPARTATLDLAERARAQDCTVVFDPNARPELWPDGATFRDLCDRAFAHADVVKATPEDLAAAGVPGENPAALAAALCERGPHTALLTLGDEGAVARATDAAPWGPADARHDGYRVDPVDTTGAGDAFTAGALAALADGEENLADVLGFANAVAALTTTGEGAMTALPTREAVRAFRAERGD